MATTAEYSLQSLYFITINYILGVGILGMPYAFYQSGLVLCSFLILTVTLMSYISVMWVAESSVRAEILETIIYNSTSKENIEINEPTEDSSLLSNNGNGVTSTPPNDTKNSFSLSFPIGKHEVIDLVQYFLGPHHGILYQFSLINLMCTGLLAYSQVFCNSIVETFTIFVPNRNHPDEAAKESLFYQIMPQLLFGMIVIPLSCSNIEDQVAIQSIMSIVRFFAIFLMVAGSIVGLMIVDNDHEDQEEQENEFDCFGNLARFSGFGVAFSTALFSQLFQHSVPGLIRPLKRNHNHGLIQKTKHIESNKEQYYEGEDDQQQLKQIPIVFGMSLMTTCSLYLILGISASSYFGNRTKPSVNLNFSNFTFGYKPSAMTSVDVFLCRIISTTVTMFPALDTLSVFPLIANTLGNNLMASSSCINNCLTALVAMVMSTIRRPQSKRHRLPNQYKEKEDKARITWFITTFWRLVASIPPLIGSIWWKDLSFSLRLGGIAGLYVAFYAPSLLQIHSVRKMSSMGLPSTSWSMYKIYQLGIDIEVEKVGAHPNGGDKDSSIMMVHSFSGWYSRNELAFVVLIFATFSLGVSLIQIFGALPS